MFGRNVFMAMHDTHSTARFKRRLVNVKFHLSYTAPPCKVINVNNLCRQGVKPQRRPKNVKINQQMRNLCKKTLIFGYVEKVGLISALICILK